MNNIDHVFQLPPVYDFQIIDSLPQNTYKKRLKRDLGELRNSGYEITCIYKNDEYKNDETKILDDYGIQLGKK